MEARSFGEPGTELRLSPLGQAKETAVEVVGSLYFTDEEITEDLDKRIPYPEYSGIISSIERQLIVSGVIANIDQRGELVETMEDRLGPSFFGSSPLFSMSATGEDRTKRIGLSTVIRFEDIECLVSAVVKECQSRDLITPKFKE